jgi:hypothetical protein
MCQLNTVVFQHWCLKCAVLLSILNARERKLPYSDATGVYFYFNVKKQYLTLCHSGNWLNDPNKLNIDQFVLTSWFTVSILVFDQGSL